MVVPVAEIEAATLALWPALETVQDGAWQGRFANGYTKRANSIHCTDPADDDNAGARIDTLAAHYSEHELPPVFRVTPLTGKATFAHLVETGWELYEPSLVLDMPLDETAGFDADVSVVLATSTEFLDAQVQLQGYDAATAETLKAILAKLDIPAAGLILRSDEGAPVASLLCGQYEGTGVFLNVVTDGGRRRRGFGRRLMATALSWVAENGARHAAIQVLAANAPALALYLGAGFTFRYPYHYRRLPQKAEQ
ncbi:GNAT family N-acetyltransferase [Pelagibacterium xiamenense]|uniref:GNAT family N-acetyltransferase n=1 Tax=Pelagibacterium xiamenense TaxID=2901140 RepID=UPI001E573061|nr:GNAT family N-acetyltransferase [Pelagibacterium xiamenense]MCD7061252.1 GNAT family N-acetyltransferase [Pelagibacterium xiamenense]